jgi:hypothetical protein
MFGKLIFFSHEAFLSLSRTVHVRHSIMGALEGSIHDEGL